MRKTTSHIEEFRFNGVRELQSTPEMGMNGMFIIPFRGAIQLAAMASDGRDWKASRLPGEPWEHVSVSVYRDPGNTKRTPTWEEMCFIKDLFWHADEAVIQFHPSKDEYVNHHEHCLHLWKMKRSVFKTPPSICVGPKK